VHSLHSHYHSPGAWFWSGLPKFWFFLLSHRIFLKLVLNQDALSFVRFFPATPIFLKSSGCGLLGWDTVEFLLVDTNVLKEHTLYIFRIHVWRHLKILQPSRWREHVPQKHKNLPTQDYKVSHTTWTTTTMFPMLCMFLLIYFPWDSVLSQKSISSACYIISKLYCSLFIALPFHNNYSPPFSMFKHCKS
jgi:hypothetical protein